MSQQQIFKCSICLESNLYLRNVTVNLQDKINNCPDKEYYIHLITGVDKLCSSCYMKIIDSERFQKSTINRNNQLDNMDNLVDNSESNISTNLMDISNLIESNKS
ncbi:6455_t:CDS:1, partial [Dentiscutata erythropus]